MSGRFRVVPWPQESQSQGRGGGWREGADPPLGCSLHVGCMEQEPKSHLELGFCSESHPEGFLPLSAYRWEPWDSFGVEGTEKHFWISSHVCLKGCSHSEPIIGNDQSVGLGVGFLFTVLLYIFFHFNFCLCSRSSQNHRLGTVSCPLYICLLALAVNTKQMALIFLAGIFVYYPERVIQHGQKTVNVSL